MRFALLILYRPTRTSDGRHGFIDSYVTSTNLYGAVKPHRNEIMLTYRAGEDVKVDDVVIADSGCYRVMMMKRNIGAPIFSATVERIQRPIFPDDKSCVGSASL